MLLLLSSELKVSTYPVRSGLTVLIRANTYAADDDRSVRVLQSAKSTVTPCELVFWVLQREVGKTPLQDE
jgi:hypothetical protein